MSPGPEIPAESKSLLVTLHLFRFNSLELLKKMTEEAVGGENLEPQSGFEPVDRVAAAALCQVPTRHKGPLLTYSNFAVTIPAASA
jgi:hypothetical protein